MTGTLVEKKLKSGKSYYYVKLSYKDPSTGKWRQKLLGTGLEAKGNKRKAEAMIPVFISDNKDLERTAVYRIDGVNPCVSVRDYAKAWIEDKKIDGIQESTAENYEGRIKHITGYFDKENTLVKDLTPYMIDRFVKTLLKYGKTNQKTGEKEPLAPRTVSDIKVILSKILDQAVVDGIIPSNPAVSVKVNGKRKKDYEAEMFFMEENECKEFISYLATSEDEELRKLAPIAFIAIYYGLRRSEILGLKWDAIDTRRKLIHIRHTIVSVGKKHAKDITKTVSSRRSLSLFKTAEAVFDAVREEQNKERAYFGNAYLNRGNYVFTREDGQLIDPTTLTKRFKTALIGFGRPELTLHKLRHTCASLLIEKGWDPKRVQYWMGHADIQTTLNIYAHYNRQKMNQSSDDLEEIAAVCGDLF